MNLNWFRVPSICACSLLCTVRAPIQDQINLRRKYNFVEWPTDAQAEGRSAYANVKKAFQCSPTK